MAIILFISATILLSLVWTWVSMKKDGYFNSLTDNLSERDKYKKSGSIVFSGDKVDHIK
jgi:hypothetical protein